MLRVLVTGAFAGLLCATVAGAQYRTEPSPGGYREGMPAVNTPAPAADPGAGGRATLAAFARWNQAQSRPSMLLFWNRELLEDGASQYDDVKTTGAAVVRGRGVAVGASETRRYRERSTDGRYGFSDDLFSKGVESSILTTFLSAGARIIDRETMMRKVSTKRTADERLDIQHLETLALGQGVQYLVEILPDDDAASPTGVTFTVKVTHLPTATVRAQFLTNGEPPTGPARFEAVSGGFEKRTPSPERTPGAIGAQVAHDVMGKLR